MRTYKDAKAMAKSLRDSLTARRVSFSHSECLEIVAKQFGLADWNTLAAKAGVESGHFTPRDSESALQPAIPDGACQNSRSAAPEQNVSCSFCGKSQNEVPRFIEGGCSRAPRAADGQRAQEDCVFICVECVTFSARIIADNGWEHQRNPQGPVLPKTTE
jgi:Glyoxalase superfamily protein/ClpX C4-type zinc finger